MIELRAEGRRLIGTVVQYGSTGDPGFPEAFEAGAFRGALGDVLLNVHHDRRQLLARTPTTLRLLDSDTALRMVATLPRTRLADDVLELVGQGVLRGLSVGFAPVKERMDGDRRIIERALLDHVAIVDRPAYDDSRVKSIRYWSPGYAMSTLPGNDVDIARATSTRRRAWL